MIESSATDIEIAAMRTALGEARSALAHGDVPVGAVILRNGEIIAQRHNEREQSRDPVAHAEMLAIQDAAAIVGDWRLTDCTMVVTLEPCVMCAGAITHARLPRLIFGAPDPKAGAVGSLYNISSDPRLNHQPEVIRNVLAAESSQLLSESFAARRM